MVNYLFLYPSTVIKSLYFSCKYKATDLFKFPIVASKKTVIKKHKSARINLNGRLKLGFFYSRFGEIGQIKYDRTILQLAPNSNLTTYEQTVLGSGVRVILGANARMEIGKNTFISSNSLLICSKEITIGENCAISWNVQIMDTDFHGIKINGIKKENSKPIKIGNRVWIGSNVTILKGVTIGDGAVISSGAIVTTDVKANTLVGGIPAKVLKEKVEWEL